MQALSDGWVVVCKEDCPTCVLIEPVLAELASADTSLTVFSQDNPAFPTTVSDVQDDTRLEQSYHLRIETVPTLLRVRDGQEEARLVGWNQAEWRAFTGIDTLGEGLPAYRPGCGSRSVEPGIADQLALRYGGPSLAARRVQLAALEDEIEACYDRGWSDGLPVVPPTEIRVYRMLQGTSRAPDEVVGIIPPNQAECTVEKVAINAVLAGCKPEYMPVVLAAIEAACLDKFCMHGVLATTYFSGPVVMVSGPVTQAIGMNSGVNALGQGNRANATIGRALQLVIRNVGGGKPGEVDRAVLGNPGKYTFCFAENEGDTTWEPLRVTQGFTAESSTVSLFAGDGVQPVFDQRSRTPESLARSFAASLRNVCHPKMAMASDAVLVVSPPHTRVFQAAGWSKARLLTELETLLQIPSDDLAQGANGITEGLPATSINEQEVISKFRPGGLTIVRTGGNAGLFSAIISGWATGGPRGSQLVTKEITG